MILSEGSDAPMADMDVLMPIESAPRDGTTIVGAYVSVTGKVLGEHELAWFDATKDFDEEDCPVNIADWKGWADKQGAVTFPSHWRPR